MKIVRRDTLPENVPYPDTGCELADSCLECPIPVCKEDDPTFNARIRRADRARAVVKAHQSGTPATTIAAEHGISSRQVHRIVQQAREGYVSPRYEETEGDADMTLAELARTSSFRKRDPLPRLFE